MLDSAPPAHIYNYAARVMYDGTDFCGWQLQQRPQGKPSVQKVGRCALSPTEWCYVRHTELPSWSVACKVSHCKLNPPACRSLRPLCSRSSCNLTGTPCACKRPPAQTLESMQSARWAILTTGNK